MHSQQLVEFSSKEDVSFMDNDRVKIAGYPNHQSCIAA
jgi:hypothetical protein